MRERRLVQDRAALRAELRAEYVKQASNPFRHVKGDGGYLVCCMYFLVNLIIIIIDLELNESNWMLFPVISLILRCNG